MDDECVDFSGTHCFDCGESFANCDCGGEGKAGQAKVREEWADQKKRK